MKALAKATGRYRGVSPTIGDLVTYRLQTARPAAALPASVIGLDLRYVWWSEGLEHLTDVPAAAVVGQLCYDVFPAMLHTGAMRQVQDALAGRATWQRQFSVVPKTNQYAIVEAFRRPLFAGGEIAGVASTFSLVKRIAPFPWNQVCELEVYA